MNEEVKNTQKMMQQNKENCAQFSGGGARHAFAEKDIGCR
jgi:hypothetical protein